MKVIVLASYTKSLLNFRAPLIHEMQARGCDVLAVGAESEAEWGSRFAANGIRYRSIPLKRNGLNPFEDLRAMKALKQLFLEEKPDKLFCSQAKAVVYGIPAARATGVSGVYALISGLGSIFHGSGLKNQLIQFILRQQYKFALAKADTVFFQNEDDRGIFLKGHIVPKEKTLLIHGSGVDIHRFAPTPFPETLTFIIVARILRDKGVSEYMEAARRLKSRYPQCRFLLVGPYDTNPSSLGPDDVMPYVNEGSIEYLGEMENVLAALADSSVFVLPSYHEGTPMSTLEAMACGRPIVTTDAPGCRETVRDNANGFLVPVKDIDNLALAMGKFIHDPSLCTTMGAESRKLAENVFASEHVNEAILSVMGI